LFSFALIPAQKRFFEQRLQQIRSRTIGEKSPETNIGLQCAQTALKRSRNLRQVWKYNLKASHKKAIQYRAPLRQKENNTETNFGLLVLGVQTMKDLRSLA